jgi:hypothetical protein
MNNKIARIGIVILLAIVIGFVQENVKVNINYLIDKGEAIPGFFESNAKVKGEMLEKVKINAPFDYYHNHAKIDFLLSLNHGQLVMLKWIATLVFIVVFMFINASIITWFTEDKLYFKRTLWMYAGFFMLALLIYMAGKFTGTSLQAYGVSREIVGGLQSLVPLMILIPASWLHKHEHFFDTK